ncbi:hypothetical protein, partial [Salmonella enterica]|uniref:hypothetical protein n=1 Tax=Salmonella enterica TaxID=28901 RepID=UPI003F7A5FCE|nr:hypothetical protein [Salmonella enterica subsp. enterica serovar Typhimurium]
MLEMTADRLVLVDGGTAREFDGSLDDYITLVLAGEAKTDITAPKPGSKEERRAAAATREADKALRSRLREAEAEAAR